MKSCRSCATLIPGEARFCPSCGAEAGSGAAPPPAGGPPAAPPPPPSPPPSFDRERARARLRQLGTLQVVLGTGVLAWVAWSFHEHATGAALASLERLLEHPNPDFRRVALIARDLYLRPWFLAVSHVVPFALAVLCCWSGASLRNLRGGTLGLVASVAMIVLGPLANCCCCLAAPLGIYGLFVLTRADSELVLREA